MKQFLTRFCCLLGGLVGTSQMASAQITYTPAAITQSSFTADVIADSIGTVVSRATGSFDTGNATQIWNLANTTYVNPSGQSPVLALPANGVITSAVATTPGLTFRLAPAGRPYKNSLRLLAPASGTAGISGTLTLVTPAPASEVVMLGAEGNGSVGRTTIQTMVVNFTDGTSQTFTGALLSDWFGGTNAAVVAGSRVNRTDNTIENATTNPRLYQARLALSATNYGKLVASVTVTEPAVSTAAGGANPGAILNVMGITLGIACQGIPNAGTALAVPSAICPGQQVAISPSGASAAGGITFQWQASTDGGVTFTNIAGATNATYIGTPSVTTIYRVILTCSGQSGTSAPATVTVSPATAVVAYGAPPAPVTLCRSGTQAVVTATPAGGTFSAGAGLSINATTGTLNLGASTAGTYTVTYTPASGSCASPATTTVTVVAPPTATLAYPAGSFCAGSGTISPTAFTPAGGTFSGSTGLVITASTGAINLNQTPAGTYTITYTTGGQCVGTTTASLTVLPASAIALNFGGTTFCKAGAAPATTATPAGGIFSSTPGLVINITTGVIDLANSTNGTYTVTYTTSGQCGGTASARVTIQGNAAPVYPTVLTPNGDQLNDQLKLKIADVQNYSLKVFNRWGRRVYEGHSATEGWDPTDNGPGTYFYQVEYTDCAGRAQMARNWVEVVK